MNKIPTMFERDWEGDRSRVTSDVHPGCEWVIAGEGVSTRKFDGTCVMFDGEKWWARREVKDGKQPPAGFRFISSGHDHVTLKNVGWEPIEQSSFAKFFAEALENLNVENMSSSEALDPIGTYELCGPKVQGNPEQFRVHTLVCHARAERIEVEHRDFPGIEAAISRHDIEGIVFHHPDGQMAKIKARDYGLKRGGGK